MSNMIYSSYMIKKLIHSSVYCISKTICNLYTQFWAKIIKKVPSSKQKLHNNQSRTQILAALPGDWWLPKATRKIFPRTINAVAISTLQSKKFFSTVQQRDNLYFVNPKRNVTLYDNYRYDQKNN